MAVSACYGSDDLGLRKSTSRILGSVAFTLIIGLAVACDSGDETQTRASPSPTPTEAPTSTPASTVTPRLSPTATPAPEATRSAEPTSAPAPTLRPEPTATPTPTIEAGVTSGHASEIAGVWQGVNVLPGLGELALTVSISVSDGELNGTIDIPAQNAFGMVLTEVTFEGGGLRFVLDSPLGPAVWEGQVLEDVVEGNFTQAAFQGTFRLHRASDDGVASSGRAVEPPTHSREEVSFQSGNVQLAGDLTIPDAEGPYPAVVLISGSGGQDRDSNIFGFKTFEVLAGHLAEMGVAVLRFDDRGTGGSAGNWLEATLQDRANDVKAAMGLLLDRSDIREDAIGLIGHSEGGLVALIASNQMDDVSYVGLLASPAIPGDDLLRAQQKEILQTSGASQGYAERAGELQEITLRAVRTGQGWDEVEAATRESARAQLEGLPEEVRKGFGDIESYLDGVVLQQMASIRSPWFKSFVEYDPRPDIHALDIPVLALFGDLDTQVPVASNSTQMSEAIDKSSAPSHTLAVVFQANHIFQEAVTGAIEEYWELEPAFHPQFLEFLFDWLAIQTGSP